MIDRRYMATCTVCGSPVDTLEQDEGGTAKGCQLINDEWVCSCECWEEAAGMKGQDDE